MNYLKFGDSKKFIIFLHGWGVDLNSFLFVKDYFCDYAKVFLDFAGFGKSPEPKVAYSVDDYVDDLKKLIFQFDIEELVFVGHSFGGRVAIKFAANYQSEFKNLKICLVDSAGIRPKLSLLKKWRIYRFKKLKLKAEKNEKLKNKLSQYGSDDYKNLSFVMKQTFVKVVNEDLSECAKKIKCPCQIIWGSKDKETKLYMAKLLNKFIKGSKLNVIKNSGHFCFIENKQEFLIILDTFLKN